jgi:hypothetical protein
VRTARIAALATTLLVGACDSGEHAPVRFTQQLMPPGAEQIVLGTSTEADALAAYPGGKWHRDTSFGGEGAVELDGDPVEYLRSDKGEVYLRRDNASTPRVFRVMLKGPGRCDWVKQHIAPLPGSLGCNPADTKRKPGEDEMGRLFYCFHDTQQRRVWVECSFDELAVSLLD